MRRQQIAGHAGDRGRGHGAARLRNRCSRIVRLSPGYSYWSGEIISLSPLGPLKFGVTIYFFQLFLRELSAPFISVGILGVSHLLAPIKKIDAIRLRRFFGFAQDMIPFEEDPLSQWRRQYGRDRLSGHLGPPWGRDLGLAARSTSALTRVLNVLFFDL